MQRPRSDAPATPEPGAHERRIARGTLAQQGSQVVAMVSMLVVVTLLGRTLTLAEFGLYGLLVTVTGYLLIIQGAVGRTVIREIASTTDGAERDRAFSAAIVMYAGFGLLAGAVIALGGALLVELLVDEADLRDAGRHAVFALGLVTAVGWPLRAYQDALRGVQRFGAAAGAETVTWVLFCAAVGALLALDAPLAALIAIGGALPIGVGAMSAVAFVLGGRPCHLRIGTVTPAYVRTLLGFSGVLLLTYLADLAIYSFDRVVLAGFRGPADVGLYEGAARPHNLILQFQAALTMTIVPVASDLIAAGDDERLHDLFVRGTRYVVAAVVPPTVVLIVLSEPILDVWLGAEFRDAALAMSLFVAYWIIGANTGVAGAMLVAAGRVGVLARYAWMVAGLNLCLSLALTPLLGLEGVVLGTAIPFLLLFPYFLKVARESFPVSIGRLARDVWIPAYTTGAALAVVLVALRLLVPLDSVIAVVAVAGGGVLVAWIAYFLIWLNPQERVLARSFVGLGR